MGKHDATQMTKARDELMSHMVRCDVLDAQYEDRVEWLGETMDYMAGRYPGLSDLQLTQLEMIGKQYIKPAIEHGSKFNAVTKRRPKKAAEETETPVEDVTEPVAEAAGVDESPAEAEVVAA